MTKNNQNSSGKNTRNNTQTPPKTGQAKNGATGREEFSRELTEIINKNTQTGQNQKTAQKRKSDF